MLSFFKNFKLIIPEIKNSLFPTLIFAYAFLGYFLYGEISPLAQHNLHIIFWSTNIIGILVLIYFNQRKPFFFLLTIILSYILINLLKRQYSLDFLSTTNYINLCFFAPVNLSLFYFMRNKRLLTSQTFWTLLFIFSEIAVAEYLNETGIMFSFNSQVDSINLNTLSVLLFTLFLIAAFIKCGLSGSIQDTSLFFSGLNIFAGFYYSGSSTALCIFFCAATVTSVTGLIKNIHYTLNYDTLTGLANNHTYLKDAPKFPMKYSLAIICLDNYQNILKIFGYFKSQKIIKMLATRLSELEPENPLYRCSTHEFILIFKNDNQKQSFEKLDSIRKEIAASEFILSRRSKGIKLTISGCVTEKKRSDDANVIEVLVRARRTLQKTYQFTQNLISRA